MFFRPRYPCHQSLKPTSPIPFNSPIPTSKLHSFSTITTTHFTIPHNFRGYSSVGGSSESLDQNKEVDTINLKFAEAREEIEMALESKDTVYFDEEAECARASVNEVLDLFEGLLAKLSEKDRAALQRSMGLKIHQLKAELQQLDE
ncbi:hypothetical protein TanjilG_03972 [Lupinus angustifolius]|uniref:Uncharacterized protein n=2 Tax=Lupinus angustifolius TaxID=3871 RepID=A0A4P1RBB8_LUPAN|nr:hypothetical protein TanjilG_03972 [Lupinus angustifolius]